MGKKRLVISLGHKDLGINFPEQKKAIAKTAEFIADYIQAGWQTAIVHSNAPQVGMINTAMNEFAKNHEGYTNAPMSVCSARSQGYIGYDLQNALRTALLRKGSSTPVSTILTQVTVDPFDEAFNAPTKKVGRYLSAEEAIEEEDKGNYTTEIAGKGFQRVVASPKPISIIEIDAIKALINADQAVICCGGGGIPVIQQNENLIGAGAIIEKDLASGLLATNLDADTLMILTSVDHVFTNFGKDNQTSISSMTVAQARQYIANGEFEASSMLPKVEAAIQFVSSGEGKRAIITSREQSLAALENKAGTIITA